MRTRSSAKFARRSGSAPNPKVRQRQHPAQKTGSLAFPSRVRITYSTNRDAAWEGLELNPPAPFIGLFYFRATEGPFNTPLSRRLALREPALNGVRIGKSGLSGSRLACGGRLGVGRFGDVLPAAPGTPDHAQTRLEPVSVPGGTTRVALAAVGLAATIACGGPAPGSRHVRELVQRPALGRNIGSTEKRRPRASFYPTDSPSPKMRSACAAYQNIVRSRRGARSDAVSLDTVSRAAGPCRPPSRERWSSREEPTLGLLFWAEERITPGRAMFIVVDSVRRGVMRSWTLVTDGPNRVSASTTSNVRSSWAARCHPAFPGQRDRNGGQQNRWKSNVEAAARVAGQRLCRESVPV